jgi:hypothetical protein
MIKIGNLPPRDAMCDVGKWYFGIELYKCHPNMVGVFRPYVFIYCFKILTRGELWKINGAIQEKLGGWFDFMFPVGIIFKIVK